MSTGIQNKIGSPKLGLVSNVRFGKAAGIRGTKGFPGVRCILCEVIAVIGIMASL